MRMKICLKDILVLLFLPQIWSTVLDEQFSARKQQTARNHALSTEAEDINNSIAGSKHCRRLNKLNGKILSRIHDTQSSAVVPNSFEKSFLHLSKRQTNLDKHMRLTWDYTCEHSYRTSQPMEYKVHYQHASNVVFIEPGKNCVMVSNQWQREFHPTGYGGHLYAYKRKDYRSIRTSCEYRFRGLIEGEVYPWALTSDFVQNSADWRLEPTVTELCYRFGPEETRPTCVPEQLCRVHNVAVESIPDPPASASSESE